MYPLDPFVGFHGTYGNIPQPHNAMQLFFVARPLTIRHRSSRRRGNMRNPKCHADICNITTVFTEFCSDCFFHMDCISTVPIINCHIKWAHMLHINGIRQKLVLFTSNGSCSGYCTCWWIYEIGIPDKLRNLGGVQQADMGMTITVKKSWDWSHKQWSLHL